MKDDGRVGILADQLCLHHNSLCQPEGSCRIHIERCVIIQRQYMLSLNTLSREIFQKYRFKILCYLVHFNEYFGAFLAWKPSQQLALITIWYFAISYNYVPTYQFGQHLFCSVMSSNYPFSLVLR